MEINVLHFMTVNMLNTLNWTYIKHTYAIHRQWRRRRRRWWWSGRTRYNSHVVRTDRSTVSSHHHATRQALRTRGWRWQDGNVSVSLLVDLDGALFLQFVDLLLQFTLSLDGLVLLLQHLPQRVNLRAGVFEDFLRGRGTEPYVKTMKQEKMGLMFVNNICCVDVNFPHLPMKHFKPFGILCAICGCFIIAFLFVL